MKRLDLLTLLADHLENNVVDAEFNMDHWRCGTVGCAVGHAVNVPEIADAGLELKCDNADNYFPVCGNNIDMRAAAKVFGLKYGEAVCLFLSDRYNEPSKANVISRIREFVMENEGARKTRPEPVAKRS